MERIKSRRKWGGSGEIWGAGGVQLATHRNILGSAGGLNRKGLPIGLDGKCSAAQPTIHVDTGLLDPFMWPRAHWAHLHVYIYIYSLCILIYFRYSPIMPFRIPFARQGSNIYIYIYSYIFGQNSRFALDCRCSSGVCQPVTNFYRFFWFSYRHGRWGPFSDFFWKGCLA